MVITSTVNPYVKLLKSLHAKKGRAISGLFLIEGVKLVDEAQKAGAGFHSVAVSESAGTSTSVEAALVRAERDGVPVNVLGERAFAFVSGVQAPQGILAAVRVPDLAPPQANALPDAVVALERVQDPGNMGTIIRTAEAAGAGAVVLSKGCCEPFSPKVVRSAAGSALRVKVCEADDFCAFLNGCAQAGYAIAAGAADGENVFSRHSFFEKFVLVIGNEASGVSDAAAACATHRLRVPMAGRTESLNAGVAAGVLLYALRQDRLTEL